ncbi:OmpH family outer membrane protein [Yoonia sp. SS1-5]|uniref:OmpH family outer membrane protein n=1 Tax=Yoonia rhodophyticola TaxID=3137370 RepID=A0AAN0MJF3_9RHOB
MRIWGAIALLLVLCLPAAAQQEPAPQILIVDSDRVYLETLYGRSIAEDLAAQVSQLQSENDAIAEQLREEELALTEQRAEMTPELFRQEADAFDEKVQELRRTRDAKNQELQVASAEARSRFEERVQGIVANIMLERNALMVMEQRNVILSVRAANITDDVITRIDAQLGDGSQ